MVSLTRAVLAGLVIGEHDLAAALAEKAVAIEGDATLFGDLLQLLDRFDFWFEIVMP